MHERTRGLFGERVMSTFSSKGAFQVTKPGILTSIDSGMTIRFIKVNGEPVRTSDLGIPHSGQLMAAKLLTPSAQQLQG